MFNILLIILFIFKLKLNCRVSPYRNILEKYGPQGIYLFRKTEKQKKRICKLNLDLEFLIKCKDLDYFLNF